MSTPTAKQGFRLGLFVFGMLLLFAGMIFVFGGGRKWFTSQKVYYAVFEEAPGLRTGSPIRKSGVQIGEVEALDLVPETGSVRVVMKIDSKYLPRRSDQPTITRTLIPGESGIDFVPRDPKLEVGLPFEPGEEIKGISPLNARALIDRASDIIPEARESMKEIRDSLRKLEELAPQVKQTLQDFSLLAKRSSDLIPELQKTNDDARMFLKTSTRWIEDIGVTFRADEPKLIAAVQSFQQTSDQFRKLVSDDNQKQITRIVNNVAQASDRFDNIAKDTEILTKDAKKCLDQLIADVKEGLKPIQQAFNDVGEIIADVKKISRTVSDRIDKIAQNLEIGSDQFARTLMDVRDILRTFSKAEGTLMKFINDPSFYLNLNETAVGVQKILPRFDRILKDLEVFADKIARHPEALGIGGAVRPDSGLKEAPTVPGPVFRPRQ